MFPIISKKLGYGKPFDSNSSLSHNDKFIEKEQKRATEEYKNKNIKRHGNGKWTEFLDRTVLYDITEGTGIMKDISLHGKNHRLYTLGHDPILGWIFGTANILTDTITISPGAMLIMK